MKLKGFKQNLDKGKSPRFLIHEDGSLQFQNRLCVFNRVEKRKQIIKEGHNSCYSVHPGGAKMYGT